MPRRGERKPRVRSTAPKPMPTQEPDHIGIRTLTRTRRGAKASHMVDPAKYRCSALAAQLADEWIRYARAMARIDGGADMAGAVRGFARFVDKHLPTLGMDPAGARLDGCGVDLVEVIHAWEEDLRQHHGLRSNSPYAKTNYLLTLIEQRSLRDASMPEALRLRSQAPPAYPTWKGEPLDEFSNAERIALRDAARNAVRALEARLAWGRELLARGVDPREGGWHEPANLVWAATHPRLLTVEALKPQFRQNVLSWPEPVKALLPTGPDGTLLKRGFRYLVAALSALLFPAETDLQAFRVLLMLGMSDTSPEELHALQLSDIEFTDGGVRLVQRKNRAHRVRADLHPSPDPEEGAATEFAGDGAWDVPGLLRRLLASTELSRKVFPDAEPWLFLAVERRLRGVLDADIAYFKDRERRFGGWISEQRDAAGKPLEISKPFEIRRLRKTTKVLRAVALGGTVSDLAGDDHHVEVYRMHYAHGTTAHILAGRSINRAQKWVFERMSDVVRPVLVTEEAEKHVEEPEVAEDLGLDIEQAKAMRAGKLDMGLVNCRNPYDSPHRKDTKVCHVAPAMCMLCRNAVVFTSQLPRLLLLSDHIERMRIALAPPHWRALWGRQAEALSEVFEECADLVPAARREIVELGLRLDLPLGMRTEFDR
ncbi:hypothetical protein SMIR_41880 (plasmid) [Streptomyces mirabilis]|uniref:hypothetical protein n=1 Tax=Streptomyces mirabilis TaxID=68239 RepID=UPI001BB05D8B|nr:hypothetical protein [Streptomyces mirabilis]QUW85600.1 hypothetical protein SMIR_41880 [Streptomyces mirabilis]